MTIRSIALLAMSVPVCLDAVNPGAPLAVYYSFDGPPPAALVTEMQAEVGRILAAAGVRVAWRAVGSPRNGEDFQAIVVFRFRGACSFDSSAYERQAEPTGQALAETDVADGRVLPFGAVDCDRLRRFIAPVLKSPGPEDKNASLGRAIARVSAHEIYHMLTGSEGHARRGIARSSHSRAELTAPKFGFAQKETDWLRAWVIKPAGQRTVATAEVGADSVKADSTESESVSLAGR